MYHSIRLTRAKYKVQQKELNKKKKIDAT